MHLSKTRVIGIAGGVAVIPCLAVEGTLGRASPGPLGPTRQLVCQTLRAYSGRCTRERLLFYLLLMCAFPIAGLLDLAATTAWAFAQAGAVEFEIRR